MSDRNDFDNGFLYGLGQAAAWVVVALAIIGAFRVVVFVFNFNIGV